MTNRESDRVRVWNTFFKLARDAGVSLQKLQAPSSEPRQHEFLGGTLDENKMWSLALVGWCYLALEARVNHLIEELREKGALSTEEAEAVRRLRATQKWALLPKLAGRTESLDFSKCPHQSVAELDGLRNHLFHVHYDRLLERLPSPGKALSLFNQFVRAMENMNVILGRHEKERPEVLDIVLDN